MTRRPQLVRRIRVVAFGLVLMLALSAPAAPAFAQAACLPVGPMALNQATLYGGLVSRSDTASARIRAEYQLLPAAASEVYLASDSTTCASAAVAFAKFRGDTITLRSVYALRVGAGRFIVFNPLIDQVAVVLDAAFTDLAYLFGF